MDEDKEIISNYPQITNMCRRNGLAFRSGWNSIVLEMLEKLPEDVEIVQIKEKFGGLRVYPRTSNEKIRDIIVEAETRSLKTCEYCAANGRIRYTLWMRTLCDRCYEDQHKLDLRERAYSITKYSKTPEIFAESIVNSHDMDGVIQSLDLDEVSNEQIFELIRVLYLQDYLVERLN